MSFLDSLKKKEEKTSFLDSLRERQGLMTTPEKQEATRQYGQYAQARANEGREVVERFGIKVPVYSPQEIFSKITTNVPKLTYGSVGDVGTALAKGYEQSNVGLNRFFMEQMQNVGLSPTRQQTEYEQAADIRNIERAQKLEDAYLPKTVLSATEALPLSLTAGLNPALAPALMGASAFGSKAKELEEMGATQAKQQLGGAISGALEGGFGYLTSGAVSRILKGSGTIKDFAKNMLGEVAEESAQAFFDPLVNKLTVDDYEMPAWEETAANMVESGKVASVMVIMTMGIGSGVQSVKQASINAMNNPTQENIDNAIQEIKQTPEAQTQEGAKAISQAEAEISEMSRSQITQALEAKGLDTRGTRAELEQRLQPSEATQQIFQQVTEQATEQAQPTTEQVEQLQPSEQTQSIFNQVMKEDVGLRDQGVSMTVEMEQAQEVANDIQSLKDIVTDEEVSQLSKYDKLIDEVFDKGISKSSLNTINRLIAAEQSIQGLKQKYNDKLREVRQKRDEKIADIKSKQKAKDLARRESGVRSELLKLSKEMQRGRLQPEFQKVADELFNNIDTMAKSMSSNKRLQLEETLAEIESLEEQGVEVDEDLKKSVARLNRKQINDMDMEEVQDLIDMAKSLKYLSQTKNKIITGERQENVDDYKQGIRETLEQQPSRKAVKAQETGQIQENSRLMALPKAFLGRPAMTLRNIMYELGRANPNSKAVQLGDMILEQQNVEYANRRKLNEMLPKNWKDIASSKEWNQEQGKRKLTSGQRVYLKLALGDPNVLNSLVEKGYRKPNALEAEKISKQEIENIKLNEQEQAVYDKARGFFDETYDLLNEAYVLLNGYNLKQVEGNYLPKKVSDITLAEELGKVMKPGGLKNTGLTQSRKGTLNELILPDIMDIYDRQINVATKYNAYVNMVKDVSKVFNDPVLRAKLRADYGTEKNGRSIIENYMDDLFQDLQGTKTQKRSGIENALRYVRTKASPAILAFRATTPVLQTASYPMALTEIDASNLVKALPQKGGFNEAAQYNERANMRQEGNIDRELAESNVNKVVEFGLRPIKFMDKATVGKLWNATKLQVEQETGLQGEELLQATSKRFDRVLDTQPNYTTADRSMTMRSQSEVDKALTMFSSAKSSVLNELQRGYIQGKYTGDWSQLSKASAGLTTSIFMMAAISNAMKRAKGDEEEFSKSLIKRATGALPLMDIVSSVINGYDISNVGVDTLEDVGRAMTSTVDLLSDTIKGEDVSEQRMVKTFWNSVDALALMLGVPVETLRDDIQIAVNVSGNDELMTMFRRFTDPYTKTEYYNEISESADDPNKLKSLLKIMDSIGTRADLIESNLKKKEKAGDISLRELNKILKQLP